MCPCRYNVRFSDTHTSDILSKVHLPQASLTQHDNCEQHLCSQSRNGDGLLFCCCRRHMEGIGITCRERLGLMPSCNSAQMHNSFGLEVDGKFQQWQMQCKKVRFHHPEYFPVLPESKVHQYSPGLQVVEGARGWRMRRALRLRSRRGSSARRSCMLHNFILVGTWQHVGTAYSSGVVSSARQRRTRHLHTQLTNTTYHLKFTSIS